MTTTITPLQQVGDFLLKRDDLFEIAGVRGGKARSCWAIAQGATGLVTASQSISPQGKIVAHVAKELGIGCRLHVPARKSELPPELAAAEAAGAELKPHPAGRDATLAKRAREDAERSGWRLIEFGMESDQAVEGMAAQARKTVAQMNDQGVSVPRVIVPVGSGISLAGILHGFDQAGLTVPVIGVAVRPGRKLDKRIDKWAPPDWRDRCQLVPSQLDFFTPAPDVMLGDVELDPHFEAKCLPFLKPGDLIWLIAIR
jgi:1-aminocyclopropane-1-carboxylate deaminase/D-cysteine desulfhydrase-like pyridoxal-dependent ACC family enzyme